LNKYILKVIIFKKNITNQNDMTRDEEKGEGETVEAEQPQSL